jgi:hypothetical protein
MDGWTFSLLALGAFNAGFLFGAVYVARQRDHDDSIYREQK